MVESSNVSIPPRTVRPPTPDTAERALRELRSLWLVPTLILAILVALLFALNRSPFPLFGRDVWISLALVIFVVVYGFVHRRAALLADVLRVWTAGERERLGRDVQRAEAQREEQLLAATAARDFAEGILQNVPAAVFVLDTGDEFLIRNANALAEAMPDPDRQRDGLAGRRLGDVFPGLDALLADTLRSVASSGVPLTLTDVEYGALGRGVTYWTFTLTPQRDPQARRVGQVIVLAVETTDRIRLLRERERHSDELERLASAERQRARVSEATLGSLSDGVVLCNAAGQLVSTNRAAQTILGADGVRPGESVAEWASRIGLCYPSGQPVPPGGVPLARTLREGRVTSHEEFLVSAGTRTVEMTAAPLLSPEGTHCVGAVAVLRDVTDLRRSRLEEAAAQARVVALLGMSRRLNATLSADQIHALVTEGALALLPPEAGEARALLYGLEDEGRRIALLGAFPDPRPKRPRTRRQAARPDWAFDAQSPFLWPLYVSRQPVVGGDIAGDPVFASESDRRQLTGGFPDAGAVKSVLALPLVAGKKVGGHLVVTSSRPDAFGDARLQDALSSLASLAAIARVNAALYGETQRKADELDALWSVGHAVVSRLDLHDLADTLTQRVCAVLGAELCTLSLWEKAPTGERSLIRPGKQGEDARLPVEAVRSARGCDGCERTTLRAAEHGEPAVCLGVANPPFGECRLRAFSGQSGAHSVLAVPLRQGEETLGALTVYRVGDAPFTPDQTKLLGTLATLAVAAVQNARAYTYERRIAQALQRMILPAQPPTVPGLEIAALYAPARQDEAQIGGDYYDFLPLGDSRLGVIIGDITGKGLAAAVQTARAKDTLRAFAALGLRPQEVVARTNTVLTRFMTPDGLLSTLFYGVWDGVARTLTYVNAGHEPPQWADPAGTVRSLEPTGPLLGLFADADYSEARLLLGPGATLALYTDGLTDCRSPAGGFLGAEGVRDTLLHVHREKAAVVAAALQDAALAFSENQPLRDDIALIVIKVGDNEAHQA